MAPGVAGGDGAAVRAVACPSRLRTDTTGRSAAAIKLGRGAGRISDNTLVPPVVR
ncbi:hypothetical protein [Streptomyces agglomeratus]|uniref:hypothetical protein n=1 Tax=Streptomyces agglomeratus TaxID=285458 RepID=UPI0014288CC4|nr:hypothetical protein [Streptomyces agglomeratus]